MARSIDNHHPDLPQPKVKETDNANRAVFSPCGVFCGFAKRSAAPTETLPTEKDSK